MCAFAGVGHRVNVRFNSDMNRIERITVYDDLKGDVIENVKSNDEKDLEYYASSALYNLFYYSSCIHTSIHVLHFFLTAALDHCSEDFEELNQWAKFYATNVPSKYANTVELLLTEDPNPVSTIFPQALGDQATAGIFDSFERNSL